MKILLVAMPDNVTLIHTFVQFPNLGLTSIAGNLEGYQVKVLDLVVYGHNIKKPLTDTIETFKPDIIGLSAMAFQFDTLLKIARYIRKEYPNVKLVAGGYHVTLLSEEITAEGQPDLPLDFIIRGEGEGTFAEFVEELEKEDPVFTKINGLSYKTHDGWKHNAPRPLLDLNDIKFPNRNARISSDFTFFHSRNFKFDVIETSRGCPYNCKFCSITQMYGKTFRKYSLDRIVKDLKILQESGCKGVFIVDDNITFDIEHFRAVCRAIIENRLNDMLYIVQVTAAGIANNPELVREMREANFQIAFVGFESMDPAKLKIMKKPSSPEINKKAAGLLRKHGICIVAGCIVGFPDDDRKTIRKSFRLIRSLKNDVMYPLYLTPYPKTEIRKELLEAGMVVNADDFSTYDVYSCNVRTKYLSDKQLFRALRWEMIKDYLDLTHLYYNQFLWRWPLLFLRTIAYNFLHIILNFIAGKTPKSRYDI